MLRLELAGEAAFRDVAVPHLDPRDGDGHGGRRRHGGLGFDPFGKDAAPADNRGARKCHDAQRQRHPPGEPRDAAQTSP